MTATESPPAALDIFPVADRLRLLRERKDDLKATLADVNAEIDMVEQELSDAMAAAECPSFTRDGKMFILTTTTRWSAVTESKDALYAALRKNGYDHLFSVNTQTLGSFLRDQIAETEDENGETHIPGWLAGLIKSYDDIGVTMRGSNKKSKN
jgi:hypothetical protein